MGISSAEDVLTSVLRINENFLIGENLEYSHLRGGGGGSWNLHFSKSYDQLSNPWKSQEANIHQENNGSQISSEKYNSTW